MTQLSNNDIIIEPISQQYSEQFKKLRLESLQNEPTAFLATFEDESKVPEEKWQSRIENSLKGETGVTIIARDGEKAVGLVGIQFLQHPKNRHIVHIWGTYTAPAYRGKGIGKQLIQKVIDIAKAKPEIKKIKIEVNPDQSAAHNLYKKLGFQEIGTAKMELFVDGKYYDAVQMEMYI